MKSCDPENKKERMLINRGFSIYMPDDEDMKEERHRQFLKLDKRVETLMFRAAALDRRHEQMLRAVASYEERRKKIVDEINEIRVTLGNWGY